MNRTVGKASWGDGKSDNNPQEGKRIPFLNFKEYNKSWKIRVVSEAPLRYYCHFTVDQNGKTVKVNCTLDETCPAFIEKQKTTCAGNLPQARYYLKVIDRAAQENPSEDNPAIKVIDVGKQIINAIGEYVDNPEYGDCRAYDITINKGPQGSMPLYTVTPARSNLPLTDEEKQLIAETEDKDHENFYDLESRIQPLSGDVVRKILGMEVKEVKPVAAAKKAEAKKSNDEDFDDLDWGDE